MLSSYLGFPGSASSLLVRLQHLWRLGVVESLSEHEAKNGEPVCCSVSTFSLGLGPDGITAISNMFACICSLGPGPSGCALQFVSIVLDTVTCQFGPGGSLRPRTWCFERLPLPAVLGQSHCTTVHVVWRQCELWPTQDLQRALLKQLCVQTDWFHCINLMQPGDHSEFVVRFCDHSSVSEVLCRL